MKRLLTMRGVGFLASLLATACQDDIGFVDPVEASDYELHSRTYRDGKPDGLWEYWYSNGAKWQEIEFRVGVKHGIERSFYPNGAVQLEGYWFQDQRDGQWRAYSEDGQPCADSTMALGTGVFSFCYADGIIAERTSYLAGIREGKSELFFENGSLQSSMTYLANVPHGPFQESDGEVMLTGEYLNGALHGLYTARDIRTSTVIAQVEYRNGLQIGPYTRWHVNGQLAERATLDEQGFVQGEWVKYHEDGSLASRSHWLDNVQHGTAEQYTEEGELYMRGSYEQGQQTGLWEFYNEDGTPNSFVEFEQGQPVGVNVRYGSGGIESVLHFAWQTPAKQETWVQGMAIDFHGGELTQLCRYERNDTVGCQTLDTGRSGIQGSHLGGVWALESLNGGAPEFSETLQIDTSGSGWVYTDFFELGFEYELKGPLLLRSVGEDSELDVFFVDGPFLYLFHRENFWRYARVGP